MLATKPHRSAGRLAPIRRSLDETYRYYRLIAGQRGDGFSAVAYAGKTSVFTGSGSDLEGALDDLKSQIDRNYADHLSRRKDNHPSPDELVLAFSLLSEKINDRVQSVLEALTAGCEVSVQQVLRRSGGDHEILRRDIARLARSIAAILSISLPKGPANTSAALDLIMEPSCVADEAEEIWTFRRAFTEAAKKYLAE